MATRHLTRGDLLAAAGIRSAVRRTRIGCWRSSLRPKGWSERLRAPLDSEPAALGAHLAVGRGLGLSASAENNCPHIFFAACPDISTILKAAPSPVQCQRLP